MTLAPSETIKRLWEQAHAYPSEACWSALHDALWEAGCDPHVTNTILRRIEQRRRFRYGPRRPLPTSAVPFLADWFWAKYGERLERLFIVV